MQKICTTTFTWNDQILNVSLFEENEAHRLVIEPRSMSEKQQNIDLDNTQTKRIILAATKLLTLDAKYASLIHEQEPITISIPSSDNLPIPIPIVTSLDAIKSRPSIERLIAPLVEDFEEQNLELRPFQQSGVNWLLSKERAILADDMGLGKTAQALHALSILIHKGEIGSCLIICPKSLLANWESEIQKWTPSLTTMRCVPSRAESKDVWPSVLGRSHITLTNYEQIRHLAGANNLDKIDLIITDESHRLRKTSAQIVSSFRKIPLKRMWALTGTPIERDAQDFAVLLSSLLPNQFSVSSAIHGGVMLKAQAESYFLRRLKKDVLQELPDVIDTKESIELNPLQRQAYRKALSKPLAKNWSDTLQRLTLLRGICDIEKESGESSKIDRIIEILTSVRDHNEKAIIFSHLLHPLESLRSRLNKSNPSFKNEILTGAISVNERQGIIRRFKSDENTHVLLCSSRVGGEGLTLTEANHVIFLNEWWNPSTNNQARDRVVRIGQERVVQVHKFRCINTVEEVLERILVKKTELFANVIDGLAENPKEATLLMEELWSHVQS